MAFLHQNSTVYLCFLQVYTNELADHSSILTGEVTPETESSVSFRVSVLYLMLLQ